ncbi:TatD family hydrolase [Robiginitalea sp. IMCC43444]|uniref:TatD family hydrolase n=1 Tax=Robiginitalea sp. IMCC43444 TaxID=3459121 RepID=UPI004041F105
MNLTDTHAHLYVEAFDEDRDEMIERAMAAGVKRFFIPAIDASYTNDMLALKRKYPQLMHLMCGLHPTHVKADYEKELEHVSQQLAKSEYVAVGEIGIDLYWDKSHLQEQTDAFRRQIRMAKAHKLPIVIHCREAFDEIFEVLESEKGPELRGIFHCFTGSYEQAQQAISYNMKLGIGGVVTFKNGKIDQFLNKIPIDHIVLETDSPYLAPVPYRGKRNESSYLREVLKKLSEIYGSTQETIASATTTNSKEVFGI